MKNGHVTCLSAHRFAPLWHDASIDDDGAESALCPRTCDLVVVGAGILGLSAARHAARQGLSVAVLDARPVGHGASGLNGGQVIPGLKRDPNWLAGHFGSKRGRALADFAARTADCVFDLINAEALDVPHKRAGWIHAAHTAKALTAIHARAQVLADDGAPVERLDAASVAALTGTTGYLGGLLDRRAGIIQPFAYVSELARIATAAGVAIETGRSVREVARDGRGWRVETPRGQIKTRKVFVATNAEADRLVAGLARTILPLHSFQIATAPLAPPLASSILPGGQAVSDSRRIVTYFRKSGDGRFVLGGRGTLGEPQGPADWDHLTKAMLRLYPALAGVPITHRWFGRVAMTLDHLPHIHEPAPGLLAVLGCQGRGIGLMTALGPAVADYIVSGDPDVLPLPISVIRPIAFHRFRRVGVAATIAWYQLLDGLAADKTT